MSVRALRHSRIRERDARSRVLLAVKATTWKPGFTNARALVAHLQLVNETESTTRVVCNKLRSVAVMRWCRGRYERASAFHDFDACPANCRLVLQILTGFISYIPRAVTKSSASQETPPRAHIGASSSNEVLRVSDSRIIRTF